VNCFTRIPFRLFNITMPLIIAALLIVAQTLVALHGVVHAGNKSLAGIIDRVTVQNLPGDTQDDRWTSLFGHTPDGSDNTSACAAWDAGFASSANVVSDAQIPAVVVYSMALSPPAAPHPHLTDLLKTALARAPPRA
jgi:hypothetical protein